MKKRKWAKALGIALGALVALCAAVLAYIPFMQMDGYVRRHVDFAKVYEGPDFGAAAERLTLVTEDGLSLAAWRVDAKKPRAAVIFTSGIHSPSVTAFFGHAAMLQKAGYSSVLVEMRAHGESEGDLICLGTKEYMDVRAAVRHVQSMDPELPIVAYGLSMGAGAAINAIGETPEIDALVTLSAFSTWPDVFADNMALMGIPRFVCDLEKPFVRLYMGVRYGFDSLRVNPLNEIRKLNGRPALLMHSRGDTQVPFASFEKLAEAAPGARTHVVDGDHHFICDDNFLNPEADEAYANAVLGFLNEHFPPSDG
ncbi:MAG: alpha/beta hydrolase [Clostridiales bacterium]|nr:alpha/beta hydrolase [Clostridiales bacterium]